MLAMIFPIGLAIALLGIVIRAGRVLAVLAYLNSRRQG
jgi:hypothetical protein